MLDEVEYVLECNFLSREVYCPHCGTTLAAAAGPGVPRGAMKCVVDSCDGRKVPYFSIRVLAKAFSKAPDEQQTVMFGELHGDETS